VPAISLEGDANGAPHPDPLAYIGRFIGQYEHRQLSGGIARIGDKTTWPTTPGRFAATSGLPTDNSPPDQWRHTVAVPRVR